MPSTIVVGAAGGDAAPAASATLALNLALALSAIGARVELRDARAGAPLASALLGAAARTPAPDGVRMAIVSGGGLRIEARPLGHPGEPTGEPFEPDVIVAEHPTRPSSGASPGSSTPPLAADLVVVAATAQPGGLRAVSELARALGARSERLRLVLPRVLGRHVDRWRLVEELDTGFPGAVCAVTVPLGRNMGSGGTGPTPTLYAPTGRAGKAYRALAELLATDLGLRRVEPPHTEHDSLHEG